MKKFGTMRYAFLFLVFIFIFVFNNQLYSGKGEPAEKRPLSGPDEEGYKSMLLFIDVMELVRQSYVDEDKVTYDKLIKGALKGMLNELDPFSTYETPELYKKTMEDTKGVFGGIGIVVTSKNNVLEVVSPMEDTPGFKAGIHAGDIIMEIDGQTTRSMDLSECVKMMKGPPGSKVSLKIYRRSDDSTKKVTVERAVIEVSPVKGARIIRDGIGYIRIIQFSEPAAEKLDEAVGKLKAEGMKALILDLRGNPGGLLTSAVQVCSRFLEEGEPVVLTEGRQPNERKEFRALKCEKTLDMPLALLVNSSSASASEIVAGCMQDHKRAALIGTKTFGKAFIQSIVPLGENGALRFTTGKYYTPDKRLIHGAGISPDIEINVSEKEDALLFNQRSMYPGVIKPEVPNSIEDKQLKRAVEILKGVCLFSEAHKND